MIPGKHGEWLKFNYMPHYWNKMMSIGGNLSLSLKHVNIMSEADRQIKVPTVGT